jgi:hypothetical protein
MNVADQIKHALRHLQVSQVSRVVFGWDHPGAGRGIVIRMTLGTRATWESYFGVRADGDRSAINGNGKTYG